MSLLSKLSRVVAIDDYFVNEAGDFKKYDLKDELANDRKPPEGYIQGMIVIMKHFFFFKREYVLLPNLFVHDILVRREGIDTEDGKIRIAKTSLVNLNAMGWAWVFKEAVMKHSLKAMMMIKQKQDNPEGKSADIIQFSDHKKTVH